MPTIAPDAPAATIAPGPTVASGPAIAGPSAGAAVVRHLGAVAELGKVRLSSLVLVTTAVGHALGAEGAARPASLGGTLLGTALAAFGANALNQWAERPWDHLMARTAARPLPSGRLGSQAALAWGLGAVVAGSLTLALVAGALPALLALAVAVLYAGLYTPLKRRTASCTHVGAVCGAIPPMIGWAAARGHLDAGAWVLFAVLYAWQIPHFLAIDWIYREDYARGGFRMLSSVDPTGRLSGRMALLYALALVPLSLIALGFGLGGWLYAAGALALGLAFLVLVLGFQWRPTHASARRVFVGSLLYLPLVLGLMVGDPTGPIR